MSARKDSRLEVDDKYHCKRCGESLPEMLVDGPVAGDGTDTDAVELCGHCQAEEISTFERGFYCRNCGQDLTDPTSSGFVFDDDWYCDAFCAEVCSGFWSRGFELRDGEVVDTSSSEPGPVENVDGEIE